MSFSFGTSSDAANTKPVRGTATMADWKAWVDGLSRYERDQLYPGMHIDLIPAWEMIEAQEERKQSVQSSGFSTGIDSVAAPSPGPVLSTTNPARPKGLLDIDYTTFKPGALTANAGQSTVAPAQAPSNTLFGSAAYAPYQPYIPPSYGQPLSTAMSPAPTGQVPMPAPVPFSGFAPNSAPGLASPIGTAPAPSTFAPTVFGTSVPSLLTGTPLNTAPATPSLFAAAAGLSAPATPGTSPDARLKGLLDQSYAKSPAGTAIADAVARYAAPGISEGPVLTQGTANRGTELSSTTQNAQFGIFADAWDWMVETVDDVIHLTAEAWAMARGFANYLMNAPQEEQTAFLKELAVFASSFNPAIGGGMDVYNMINNPDQRTLANIGLLIAGFLPGLRAIKAARPLLRRIQKFSKQKGPRKGSKPADVPENPVPATQTKASSDAPRKKKKNGEPFKIPPKYREILAGVATGFVVEAIVQSQLENPNYWLAVVQGLSGGATGAVSGLDGSTESQLPRQWGLETLNTIATRLSRLELTGDRITMEKLFDVAGERGVALAVDAVSLGYKMGIEKVSRRQNWDRSLTNGLKQVGLPLVKGVIEGVAYANFGIGDEPDLIEIMDDMTS